MSLLPVFVLLLEVTFAIATTLILVFELDCVVVFVFVLCSLCANDHALHNHVDRSMVVGVLLFLVVTAS